jgi:thymidylate kinase
VKLTKNHHETSSLNGLELTNGPLCTPSEDQALASGILAVQIAAMLESSGLPVVYLRNHDQLPHSIGNDVDLLVPSGMIGRCAGLISLHAAQHGWTVLRSVRFSPLSIFLVSRDTGGFLHLDLFDRLEWHFIEYADPVAIRDSRIWNGLVYHPSPADEAYLNLSTRLVYHGHIREKHRVQLGNHAAAGHGREITNTFIRNLGRRCGKRLADAVLAGEWHTAESMLWHVRLAIVMRHAVARPVSALLGILRYAGRSLGRLFKPPGPFIVFEGADGVGKSTLIGKLIPVFGEITGRTDTLVFHWKPNRQSMRLAGDSAGPAVNPRSKPIRSRSMSLLFLLYHWFGFWKGYLQHIRPAKMKNRAVIGDRYAYEFYLDPARLRLNVPDWLARLATSTVPRPDLVFCMVAHPSDIILRKPELNADEIRTYQAKLSALARSNPRFEILNSACSANEVFGTALNILVGRLTRNSI